MIRRIFYIIFFSFLFFSCEKNLDPNVLIFMTDDQGWGDLSIHGNTNLKTPNIDSCLLYTSPSPRDCLLSRMPSSA